MKNNKPLILILDDDQNMNREIARMIRQTGRYEVLSAYDPMAAFVMIAEHSSGFSVFKKCAIDLLILDQHLPQMTGTQFAYTLESKGKCYLSLPKVFFSADDAETILKQVSGRKVVGCFTKIFNEDAFLALIERACFTKDIEAMIRELEQSFPNSL